MRRGLEIVEGLQFTATAGIIDDVRTFHVGFILATITATGC
jgi:hypothetical protein